MPSASPSSSVFLFTPVSSPSRNVVGLGTGGILIPSPPLSPKNLSPDNNQFHWFVLMVVMVMKVLDCRWLVEVVVVEGWLPRRNPLGELKIPARISQAQVALRRDLEMLREFASNVERWFFLFLTCFLSSDANVLFDFQ